MCRRPASTTVNQATPILYDASVLACSDLTPRQAKINAAKAIAAMACKKKNQPSSGKVKKPRVRQSAVAMRKARSSRKRGSSKNTAPKSPATQAIPSPASEKSTKTSSLKKRGNTKASPRKAKGTRSRWSPRLNPHLPPWRPRESSARINQKTAKKAKEARLKEYNGHDFQLKDIKVVPWKEAKQEKYKFDGFPMMFKSQKNPLWPAISKEVLELLGQEQCYKKKSSQGQRIFLHAPQNMETTGEKDCYKMVSVSKKFIQSAGISELPGNLKSIESGQGGDAFAHRKDYTGTLHKHDPVLLRQISGSKEVYVAHPNLGSELEEIPRTPTTTYKLNPFEETPPEGFVLVKMGPGDSLFIPEGWIHCARSKKGTVAVAIKCKVES